MPAVPNCAPFRQKSLGDCTRPLLPTQSWITGLTKNGRIPKGTCGLMGTQHPAVLGDHPVVSAQSQLSTCGDHRPVHKGVHPTGDVGGLRGSINLLASHNPIPSTEMHRTGSRLQTVREWGSASSEEEFREVLPFPPGSGLEQQRSSASLDSQPVVAV